MAKSIRSKWRQKMRNEKRKKLHNKELERLKRIAGTEMASRKAETVRGDQTEAHPKDVASSTASAEKLVDNQDITPMAVDESTATTGKKYNKRMLDEQGHYPPWMNKRRIKKMKEVRKKSIKKKRS